MANEYSRRNVFLYLHGYYAPLLADYENALMSAKTTDEVYELSRELDKKLYSSDHEVHEFVTVEFKQTDGRPYWRNQCRLCGEMNGACKKPAAPVAEGVRGIELSELRARYSESARNITQARIAELQNEKNADWWRRYNEYLRSPEWEARRNLVLDRDNFECQARLPGCAHIANHVHHLNYDHVFNEPLFDLESVCKSCHDRITEIDRARRAK